MKKIKKYNFLIVFLVVFGSLVVLAAVVRYLAAKPVYLYTRVKVGQGLWWAATQKPDYWFINSIKSGEKEVDLMGRPVAEIIGLHYYPVLTENSYPRVDIFLDLKLKTSYDKKSGRYTFKRDVLSVGSPIEFQFPSVNITGTVIDMGNQSFKDKYVEKTVYLYNYTAYAKVPYLFDSIKVGDQYFDGKEVIFRVLDKELIEGVRLPTDIYGRLYEQLIDTVQHILVRAKVKFIERDNQLFYGQERAVKTGDSAPFLTDNFNFETFVIVKIE